MPVFDKGELRRLALSRRNLLDDTFRREAGLEISRRILAQPALKEAGIIMSYMAMRSEAPLGALHRELARQGKRLCFPVCEKSGLMRAFHPLDESCWRAGFMGIMEPEPSRSELIAPEDIELVICPMVAFDGERHRLGYGGGYYDRYLPQCKKALRVGVAFEVQRLDNIPADGFDVPMHAVATEEKWY